MARSKWLARVKRAWRKSAARRRRQRAAAKKKAAKGGRGALDPRATARSDRHGLLERLTLQAHRWIAARQAGRLVDDATAPRPWESDQDAAQRREDARELLRRSGVPDLDEGLHRDRLRRFDRRHQFVCAAHIPPARFASAADLNQHMLDGHPEPVRHERGTTSKPVVTARRMPKRRPPAGGPEKKPDQKPEKAAPEKTPPDKTAADRAAADRAAQAERREREAQAARDHAAMLQQRQLADRQAAREHAERLVRLRYEHEREAERRAENNRRWRIRQQREREDAERERQRAAAELRRQREEAERERQRQAAEAKDRLPDPDKTDELVTKANLVKAHFQEFQQKAVVKVGASDATTTLGDIGSMPVTTVSQISEIAAALEGVANSFVEAVAGFRNNARTSEQAPIKEEVLVHLAPAESAAEQAAVAVIKFLSAFNEEYAADIAAAKAGERMDNTALVN